MIKHTKDQLADSNKVISEVLGSLAFVLEYFEANNPELEHLPNGAINGALANAIRALEQVNSTLFKADDTLDSLQILDVSKTGSETDANKIIDLYLATIDSDFDLDTVCERRQTLQQMMRDNQERRKQRLVLIDGDNVKDIHESS